jgi:hypothetical protein
VALTLCLEKTRPKTLFLTHKAKHCLELSENQTTQRWAQGPAWGGPSMDSHQGMSWQENVSLADILSLRDRGLSEQEAWAVCLECSLSMQSVAHAAIFQTLCITPDTLAFNTSGNVCFMEQLSGEAQRAAWRGAARIMVTMSTGSRGHRPGFPDGILSPRGGLDIELGWPGGLTVPGLPHTPSDDKGGAPSTLTCPR